jgi:Helix-turn-helix domain of resolvase
MTHTARAVSRILTRSGRPTKFTPERIQQIKNLVERGKSRDEIAELVGVTVGSLQVTCSRLGISLRRIVVGSPEEARQTPNHGSFDVAPLQRTPAQSRSQLSLVGEAQQRSEKHQERPSALEPGRTAVAIKIQYKGEERTTKLSLTEEMIVTLALEAQLRHMTIGEFITEIIVATLKKDLLQVVLAPTTVPGE